MARSPGCATRLLGEEQSPPPTCWWGGGLCSSPSAALGGAEPCRWPRSESRGDRVRDGVGFLLGFLVGDAEGGVARAHEFAVAPAVALEGERGGVEVAAVGLDDEAVVGPEEVDLDAAVGDLDRGVEERGGEVAPRRSGSTFASSGLLRRPFLRDRRCAAPFVDEGAQAGIPRRPGSIDASIAGMSRSRRCAARSKQLRSVRSPTVPARSTRVRAGLVQGMPSTVPTSSRRGGRTR